VKFPLQLTWADLGDTYDGPHATPQRVASGPYFLNISSLSDGRLDLAQSDHVTAEEFTKWTRRVTPQADDLLFSYETRLGEAALMPDNVKACLGRRMALLRPNRDVVHPRFLLYYYLSPAFQQMIEQNTIHGATVNRISLSTIGKWPVTIPSIKDQQGIAEVLGALDDKIAANTKLASTVDEWVRAEYDRIANLSDEKCTIADLVAHRRNAADPSTFEAHVPYVGLEHIPRRSMWLEAHGSSDEVSSNKSHFQSGDILFGKLRPYFHKIVTAPKSGICSTDVLVLTSIDESLSGFALASITHDNVVQAVTASSEGTRMPRTSWKNLSNVEVPWPGQMTATAFSAKVQTVRSSVIGILAENQTLSITRDALLPQLMTGKLRVKNAEEIVAAAI
jgi:type I restriction enzyme S subunit